MSKKVPKKGEWYVWLTTGLYALVGIVIGLLLLEYMERMGIDELTAVQKFLFYILVIVCMYIAVYFDIILHETGHLIFGLLSGYRFVSFRIGSLTLLRNKEGKLVLKRMRLPGTGGQCLMAPPDMVDGKIPVVLYNLGGCIVNAIAGVLMLIAYVLFCPVVTLFSLSLMTAALFNFAVLLTNGIPMRTPMITNDGSNALSLGKNKSAMRAFWLQLKINEQISQGLRPKELPSEWFDVPSDEDMKNSMIAAIGVFACNRAMDEGDLARADAMMVHLLSIESGMIGIHRQMLLCDRMFCEIMGENRPAVLCEMRTPEQLKFIKMMRTNLSVIRTEYAYALLTDVDEKRAAEQRTLFEKFAAKYPYEGDIVSERELIALADTKYRENKEGIN